MIGKGIVAPRLQLGCVVATPGVLGAVPRKELLVALDRHQNCDWGDVSPEDQKSNNYALHHGERVFSAYIAKDKTRFWIITEADRSATTLLLPEEY